MDITWKPLRQYNDITCGKSGDGIIRIAINRPEVRNAFRPETLDELLDAFTLAAHDTDVGCVLLTGEGPSKDGKWAFCSGGDQRIRGDAGYVSETGGVPRLHVLELQRLIRSQSARHHDH